MIVIGYTADEFGKAALDAGIEEARRRDTDLLVVNSTKGDSYIDAAFAQPAQVRDVNARLSTCGVAFEVEQPVGVFAADALLKAMERPGADVLVIGLNPRTRGENLLWGSAPKRVLWKAPKRVLAVKPADSV